MYNKSITCTYMFCYLDIKDKRIQLQALSLLILLLPPVHRDTMKVRRLFKTIFKYNVKVHIEWSLAYQDTSIPKLNVLITAFLDKLNTMYF